MAATNGTAPPDKGDNIDDAETKAAASSSASSSGSSSACSGAFYSNAELYWSTVEPTESGMMGGNDSLDELEISSSRLFLRRACELCGLRQLDRALDCGAGIGRVTKKLLLPLCRTVDMAEVTQQFLDKSLAYIGQPDAARVGRQFCCGLQHLQFPAELRYDLVWLQWVVGHLRDDHLVAFLQRATAALGPRGLICIKDNVITARSDSEYDFDETDSSVCRPRASLLKLFARAGLQPVLEEAQADFPESLYPVIAFALVPRDRRL